MKKHVVYIAGPYRAKPIEGETQPNQWAQQQNIRRAEKLAWECWHTGVLVPICPHLNTAHFQGSLPDSVWLSGDLEILARCDAVILCPWWRDSEGSCKEVEFATERGIPAFKNVGEALKFFGYEKEYKPHD